jgi:hypothetical protein
VKWGPIELRLRRPAEDKGITLVKLDPTWSRSDPLLPFGVDPRTGGMR